jgi:glutamate dehydrogenase (NAD(P)+)
VLVSASDSRGTIVDEQGLDVPTLIALKAEGQPLHDYPRGRKLGADAVIDVPCEIWIPAARPDVIHEGNVARLQTRVVAEGANIPCTIEAEQALAARRARPARFYCQCRRRDLRGGRISLRHRNGGSCVNR